MPHTRDPLHSSPNGAEPSAAAGVRPRLTVVPGGKEEAPPLRLVEPPPAPPEPPPWRVGGRGFYLSVRARFVASVAAGLAWAGLSAWLALPWILDLGRAITLPLAVAIIAGIAVIPGYLNVQLVTSLALDRPRPLGVLPAYPGLTLLIAAYNEEGSIEETLVYALRQDYPGELVIVVADDGSSDATPEIVRRASLEHKRVRLVSTSHAGKASALNAALASVETPLVATIDADTLLMPYALRHAVSRLRTSPPDTVEVAGSVLVRNSRENVLARVQEWDYFLGIASVKREQALLQGTLVAQGAFSVYDAKALRAAGGWPDMIGEDIVLTWAMIRKGGRVTFEPTAIAFTEVPTELRHFVRQRQRWARGMIEALCAHGSALVRVRKTRTHSIAANYLFPYLDGVYTLAVIPGIVLACLGNFAIVGPMTAAVLPISTTAAMVMYVRQRRVFSKLGLRVRWNPVGFLLYLLVYQLVMSPISFAGYVKELVQARRVW